MQLSVGGGLAAAALCAAALMGCGSGETGEGSNLAPAVVEGANAPEPPTAADSGKSSNSARGVAPNGRTSR